MGCSFETQKGITITNTFQKILKESSRKPNKIWVDKGSEFYNKSMKSWLEQNDIEMYSTECNEFIMKENLLLLEDSLEPSKIKYINT